MRFASVAEVKNNLSAYLSRARSRNEPIIVTDGDRIQRYEVFDTCDTDRALARFEELSADLPSRRPGDAALRELG